MVGGSLLRSPSGQKGATPDPTLSTLRPAVPTQEGTPVCELKDRGWWVSGQSDEARQESETASCQVLGIF